MLQLYAVMRKVFLSLVLLCTNLLSYSQTTILMEEDGGVYKVPCTINGLKLKFIFDTGASTVSISSAIASMMLENGYLTKNDIKGNGSSVIANGEIVDHTQILIKELEIGGVVVHNVDAVVIHNQSAPLLLGQSAIQRIGKVSISGNKLIIDSYNKSSAKVSYSNDELWNMLVEAKELYLNNSYLPSIEKFEVLDQCGYLLPEDIYVYASCLSAAERDQESYQQYLRIEDWEKENNPSGLGFYYECVCSAAYFAMDYSAVLRYGSLALSKLNVLQKPYYFAVRWMANSYIKQGNAYKAQSIIEDFIKKYAATLGISVTDCWTKGYKDPNLANAYGMLSFLFDDFNKAEKYLMIAAAWGDKESIEFCRKNEVNYYTKPYQYVY